jgi:hypothetical protein
MRDESSGARSHWLLSGKRLIAFVAGTGDLRASTRHGDRSRIPLTRRSYVMWGKINTAIAALLVLGVGAALSEMASAQSAQKGKSVRAPKWGDPGYYEGWVAPPARAGGVGFKRTKKKAKK